MGDFEDLPEVQISGGDIEATPGLFPEFRVWAWKMFWASKLQVFVRAVIGAGEASNAQEALSVLCEIAREENLTRLRIACCDRKGKKDYAQRSVIRLREAMTGKRSSQKGDPCLVWGTLGHQIMPAIASGEVFSQRMQWTSLSSGGQQPSLFCLMPKEHQPDLFGCQSGFPISAAVQTGRLNTRRIEAVWRMATYAMQSLMEKGWQEWFTHNKPLFAEFLHLFSPLLNGRERILRRHLTGLEQARFAFLSMMSWAAAIAFWRDREPTALFSEIPVTPHFHDISGGIIDALRVTAIGGKKPRKTQQRLLQQMGCARYSSLTELVIQLRRVFNKSLELEVIDWKFPVGDSGQARKILSEDEAPLGSHIIQVKEYLSIGSASLLESCVQKATELNRGKIIYLFPSSPALYPITMDLPERRDFLSGSVFAGLEKSEANAKVRVLTNRITNEVLRLYEESPSSHNENGEHQHQPSLFLDPLAKETMLETVSEFSFEKYKEIKKIRAEVDKRDPSRVEVYIKTENLSTGIGGEELFVVYLLENNHFTYGSYPFKPPKFWQEKIFKAAIHAIEKRKEKEVAKGKEALPSPCPVPARPEDENPEVILAIIKEALARPLPSAEKKQKP